MKNKSLMVLGLLAVGGFFTFAPRADAHDWSGAYAGANIGGAYGEGNPETSVYAVNSGDPWYFGGTDFDQINGEGARGLRLQGLTSGGQIGYNQATGDLLWGLEMDFNHFNLDRQHSFTSPYLTLPGVDFTLSQRVRSDWLLTLRPRLGIIFDRILLYTTAGMSMTQIKYNFEYSDNYSTVAPPDAYGAAGASRTKIGWIVGGGLEYALDKNWFIRGEYLYTEFDNLSIDETALTRPASPDRFENDVALQAHIVRLGINYKF